jgi:hypothetical protein
LLVCCYVVNVNVVVVVVVVAAAAALKQHPYAPQRRRYHNIDRAVVHGFRNKIALLNCWSVHRFGMKHENSSPRREV